MIDKVFIIHHSHTDIGFTDCAANVVQKQVNDLNKAVQYCDQDPDFRWTCESAWVPHYLLRDGSRREAEALLAQLKNGRIEISGCYTQYLTECMSPEELDRSFDFVRWLRDCHNISCRSALISDIGGYSWALPRFFAKAGIEFFCAGVGGYKTLFMLNELPNLFRWQSREKSELLFWQLGLGGQLLSGNRVLPQYGMALYAVMVPMYRIRGKLLTGKMNNSEWHDVHHEILTSNNGKDWQAIEDWFVAQGKTGLDSARPDRLLQLLTGRMESSGYPFDAVLMQYAADNLGADFSLTSAIREWNRLELFPRLILATPGEFFDYILNKYGRGELPVKVGELACSWSDHAIHMPDKTALARVEGNRLGQIEALAAAAGRFDLGDTVGENYRRLSLFYEHTFGLNCFKESEAIISGLEENTLPGISDPMFERLVSSWDDKGIIADEIAHTNRNLLAKLIRRDTHRNTIINTLPWQRREPVFIEKSPPFEGDGEFELLPGLTLPPLCPVELSPDKFNRFSGPVPVTDMILETAYLRLTLRDGAVCGLFDKLNQHELIDRQAEFSFNQYVLANLENLAPKVVDGGIREQVKMCFSTPAVDRVLHYHSDEAEILRIFSSLETGGGSMPVIQTIVLHKNHLRSEWFTDIKKPPTLAKEEHYLAFPFTMDNFRARCGLADDWFEIGRDELSGSHADYYTTQNWVDINDGKRGLVWTCRESMVFEIDGIRTHRWENPRKPESAQLFAYLMSNNSLTNLPLYQQGVMRFSFALTPYPGTFDFARSMRAGLEWCNPPLLVNGNIPLPDSGLEIKSGHPDVLVKHIFPGKERTVGIRLLETSGKNINTVLSIKGRNVIAASCNDDKLPHTKAQVSFNIEPYASMTIYLTLMNKKLNCGLRRKVMVEQT